MAWNGSLTTTAVVRAVAKNDGEPEAAAPGLVFLKWAAVWNAEKRQPEACRWCKNPKAAQHEASDYIRLNWVRTIPNSKSLFDRAWWNVRNHSK